MEGKWKTNLGKYIAAATLCLVLIVGVSSLFIANLNHMVHENIMNTIDELATHDNMSVQNFLDKNWTLIQGIQQRLELANADSTAEIQNLLRQETEISGLYSLMLVDDDDNVYTDSYRTFTVEELGLENYTSGITKPIVLRYEYKPDGRAGLETVLFAIPLENMELNGDNYQTLIGLTKVQAVKNQMHINSFFKDGEYRGSSSVFNPAGFYIVNYRKDYALDPELNLYALLESGVPEEGWDAERVQQNIEDRNTFYFEYRDPDGTDFLLYFLPVDNTNWYLLTRVETSVFYDITGPFTRTSVFLVIITILAAGFMLIFIIFSLRRLMKADAIVKVRTEFLSNMSHEIRTPLNGIQGLLYLIKAHTDPGQNPQVSSWALKAGQTANYLENLVNNLLEMSKLNQGKLKLNNRPFLVDEMVDSVYELALATPGASNVNLNLEKNITIPCIVGDEMEIKQVILNMLSNAIKFTPSGNPIWLRIRQEPVDDTHVQTIIECEDTGVGMSKAFQDKIWETFERESRPEMGSVQGTGLGMSISKKIVDSMPATLTVDSTEGKGSVFTFTLTTEFVPESTLAEPQSAEGTMTVAEVTPTNIPKMIVAEDDLVNAEVLKQILTDRGFDVDIAQNGQKVLDLLNRSKPWEYDGIIMDLKMPVMDGLTATQNIRKGHRTDIKTIPIFAYSACSFAEDREAALKSGMDSFINKPLDVERLLEKINIYHQFKYREVSQSILWKQPDSDEKSS